MRGSVVSAKSPDINIVLPLGLLVMRFGSGGGN